MHLLIHFHQNSKNLNSGENVQNVEASDINHAITIENKEHIFSSKLQKWAINENVAHSTLNNLLKFYEQNPAITIYLKLQEHC